MIGYATHLDVPNARPEKQNAISVVISPKFPSEETIRETLEAGIAAEPIDTVWVLRGKPRMGEAANIALEVFAKAGIEPILAESNLKYWEGRAGIWRDTELVRNVRMCVVFHDKHSATTGWFVEEKARVDGLPGGSSIIKVLERGRPKPKKRKATKRIV